MRLRRDQRRLVVGISDRVVIASILALALCLAVFEASESGGFVRGVVGVLASVFASGYLLLVLAGVRCPRNSKLMLYAVGVSSAFLVAVGLLTSTLLSVLGVARPLESVTWVFVCSLLALAGVAYYRADGVKRSLAIPLSPRALLSGALLVLLPLLAVVVTTAASAGVATIPSLILVGLLAGVVVFLVAGAIPRAMHPFAIWSVALSVLLQMTLVSPHLWGWDIHFEYYTAYTIAQEGFWNPATDDPSNSLLVITLLAVVYGSITNLDLVMVYKFLYPLVVSLLPVALYHLAASEFEDEWVAVLTPFAFVFYYGFFKFFPDKQIVAELFLVLILLSMFDDSVTGVRGRALGVVFGAMMVLSHYGTSALFAAFFVATLVLLVVAEKLELVDAVDYSVVRPTFATLVGVGWVGWYVFSASGVNFERVVVTAHETLAALSGGVSERSGVGYATQTFESLSWAIYKLLNFALAGFVSVGVATKLYWVVVGRGGDSDDSGDGTDDAGETADVAYMAFSSVVLCFLATSFVLTFGIGFDRTFLIALAVLAPFALVGLRTSFAVLSKVTRGVLTLSPRQTACVFAVFLAVFFLFSSGGAFVVTGEDPPSYSINFDAETGWPVYERSEVAATRWLEQASPDESKVAVYNDWSDLKSRDGLLVKEVIDRDRILLVWLSRTELDGTPYIYVSDEPMVVERSGNGRTYLDPRTTPFYARHVVSANRVYDTGTVRIYRARSSGESDDRSAGELATTNQTNLVTRLRTRVRTRPTSATTSVA